MRCVIDQGHPSSPGDTGCAHGELIEADWTLPFGLFVARLLSHVHGIDVEVTRNDDSPISLEERGALAAAFKADYVVSLHVNAYRSSHARGCRVYYLPGDEIGLLGARAAVMSSPPALRTDRIVSAYNDPHTKDDDWKEAPRAVLGAYDAPCTLIEIGFASNEGDRAFLLDPLGMCAAAAAPYAAVCAVAMALRKR
jgi:N-acetylmuramoyl-L-alanine amidase